MKTTIFVAIIAITVSLLGAYLISNQGQSLGAGTVYSPILTQGVWVVTATSTASTFTSFEVSTSLFNASVNGSKSASSTPVQILAPNSGRVSATICAGGQNGYLAVGSSVSATSTDANYFVAGTGILVPANTCRQL